MGNVEITFATACKKFFGLLPNQTLTDFSAELKALTPEDKAELRPMLETALGYTVIPAASGKTS